MREGVTVSALPYHLPPSFCTFQPSCLPSCVSPCCLSSHGFLPCDAHRASGSKLREEISDKFVPERPAVRSFVSSETHELQEEGSSSSSIDAPVSSGGDDGVLFQFAGDGAVNVEAIHGLLTKFSDVTRSSAGGWGCIKSFRIDNDQLDSLNSLVNDQLVEEEIAEVMRSTFGIIPMGAAADGGGDAIREDEEGEEGLDVRVKEGNTAQSKRQYSSHVYGSRVSAAITGTSRNRFGRSIQTLSHARLVDAKEMLKEQLRRDEVEAATVCSVCGSGEGGVHGNLMLLCDMKGCGGGCHMQCMTPKMKKVPKGNWYCTQCSELKVEEEGVAGSTAVR
jgi:hypothetical protein